MTEPAANDEESLQSVHAQLDQVIDALTDLRSRIFDQLFPNNDGFLYNHAVREMQLAGLNTEDADYDGDLYKWVLQIVRVFVSQGHSGGSASRTLDVFCRLCRYETLTPNDHSLYRDVSDMVDAEPGTHLQDLRNSRFFSDDAGKTWYMVDDAGSKIPETEP